jgi:ribosomal protein S18 acetylase RimI-like enzyme
VTNLNASSEKAAVAVSKESLEFRPAQLSDLDALLEIENISFSSDRLNRRSFRHWIKAEHGILQVASSGNRVVGYALVWCHKGTRLARLYSLAVHPDCRGLGVSSLLLNAAEILASERGHIFMRLEVSEANAAAIALYERSGYRVFGEYDDYYDDHSDALRMQKIIRKPGAETTQRATPWYQQTTPFTCGPAALMMAMSSLAEGQQPSQGLELDLWREATSIFMTSGHGGCHPFGLALAAAQRSFEVELFVNTSQPLFLDGVRSEQKKSVMTLVHEQFCERVEANQRVSLHYEDISQSKLAELFSQGYALLVLIRTYRLDSKKTPHWVVVTGFDEQCIYVHDPYLDEADQRAVDCQYLPIASKDFDKMSVFGSSKLRTALAIRAI